jgi:pimeloyl-ACP methyl ester carboxylesterase
VRRFRRHAARGPRRPDASIRCPRPPNSSADSPISARGLLTIKPDLEVGITLGAGHFHQLEVPEQVNAMIERFLAISL